AQQIHRYQLGLVGNCSYIAYVDTQAHVKWMCLPRFDDSFVFRSLLDKERVSEILIRPVGKFKSIQYYININNVLCTEFTCSTGSFRVIDCAPRFQQYERFYRPLMLVRKLEVLKGNPYVLVKCSPRGNYGALVPKVVMGSNHLRFLNFDMPVRLT